MRLRLFFSVILLICSLQLFAQNQNPASAYIQQLAIDHEDPNIIYAATTSAGLYKSIDKAEIWKSITPDTSTKYYVVRIAPDNPNRIYAGGERTGLWISNDRGKTWESVQLPGISICEMAITPSNPETVFVLSRNAIYRTKDVQANKWDKVFDYFAFQKNEMSHLSDEQIKTYTQMEFKYLGIRNWVYSRFQKIAVSPHDPDVILLGARWEGGYFRSDDGGESWQNHWISGIFRRVDPIVFHPTNPSVIYVGTHHQGWFKTYNDGKSWVSLSRGIAPQRRTPYYGAVLISGVVMNPQNPDEFYTGGDYSNWKTTNGGISWQELGRSLTCEFARSFAVDPVNTNIVYAGTNVGVFKSRDEGNTWHPVNRGFPTLPIKQTVEVDILGVGYQYTLTEKGPQIFRKRAISNDQWQSMNWLLNSKVDSIHFDPVTQHLILKTGDGDITSIDGGFRWSTLGVQYQPGPISTEVAPFEGNPEDKNYWTIDVAIQGKPFFADSLVDDYYKRPPYVSIQLVSESYPVDGSDPVWEGNFERYLKGLIQIPKKSVTADQKYVLYVEVRDFQWNVFTGHAGIRGLEVSQIEIPVSASHLLPALIQ